MYVKAIEYVTVFGGSPSIDEDDGCDVNDIFITRDKIYEVKLEDDTLKAFITDDMNEKTYLDEVAESLVVISIGDIIQSYIDTKKQEVSHE